MGFKSYFIKKGNHRSGFFPNLYLKMVSSKYEIMFSDNCFYKLGDVDDYDINKLFGISFGLHHKNSMRFGWNIDEDKIAIYAYYYKLGIRFMNKLISINANEVYTFEIKVHDNFFELSIVNKNHQLINTTNIAKAKTVNWGYRLFPYFGGNKCAPHDMEIKMKKIN